VTSKTANGNQFRAAARGLSDAARRRVFPTLAKANRVGTPRGMASRGSTTGSYGCITGIHSGGDCSMGVGRAGSPEVGDSGGGVGALGLGGGASVSPHRLPSVIFPAVLDGCSACRRLPPIEYPCVRAAPLPPSMGSPPRADVLCHTPSRLQGLFRARASPRIEVIRALHLTVVRIERPHYLPQSLSSIPGVPAVSINTRSAVLG
jgi:hypothetical protein